MRNAVLRGMLLLLCCLFVLPVPALCATSAYSLTRDTDGQMVTMPVSYTVTRYMDDFGPLCGGLAVPQDIDCRNGLLYVADTGNNRIVVLSCDLVAQAVFTGGETSFNGPQGVYVDADGDIYVADTGNGRIVHLSPAGEVVETFSRPESSLYDAGYAFRPLKLCIDHAGQFYLINDEDYHGFIVMDALGEFKGYVAPTRVESSLLDRVIERVATEEQQAQLDRKLPPVHTNFFMDETGAVYVTTGRTETAQLKKFLSYGSNIFPYTGVFGAGKEESRIVDVTVSADGIITLLEKDSGLLYQYDGDGNMLTCFGGFGNWRGTFMAASSLCQDEAGNLYVLDGGTGTITVWKPTSFIRKVHEAIRLSAAGLYTEAMRPWQDVLSIDQNYPIARIGMGKAYMRQQKYAEALEQYTIAGYVQGYSEAYAGLRHEFFRAHFGLVVLAAALLIVLGYYGIRACARYAARLSATDLRKGRL